MGKAARAKTAKQALNEIRKEQELKNAAKKKKRTIFTIITAAVCVILVAVFVVTIIMLNLSKTNGEARRRRDALKTENFIINGATFTYFLNYEYQNFVNTYADNLESYGLDVTTSLREQETSDGQNWFDYMVGRTESNLKEILYLCEKGKEMGIELGESEKKELSEFSEGIDKSAKKNKMEVKDYIYLLYGQGVNKEDIEKGLELSMLGTKVYDKLIGDKKYSENEILKFYNENKNSFLKVDYKYYTFSAKSESTMTEAEIAASAKMAEANAEKLVTAKTPAQFDNILTAILKAEGTGDDDIGDVLKSSVVSDAEYDESSELSQWAFGEGVKQNDTKILKSGSNCAVYMVTTLPKRDESETRSVRHILISSESYDSDDKAKAKAQEVLDKYNKGNKTAESFGELAAVYSEDTGSANKGGLYDNFAKGIMVAEFENWSFDAARKPGDTGIVKTSYGYHVMYFESVGEAKWKSDVIDTMKQDEYTALFDAQDKKFKTAVNKKILDDIPVIEMKTSTFAQ